MGRAYDSAAAVVAVVIIIIIVSVANARDAQDLSAGWSQSTRGADLWTSVSKITR